MSLLSAARRAEKRQTMKKIALLLSLLAAGATAPVFAIDSQISSLPIETGITLDDFLAQSRVSVGASRESVRNQLRDPSVELNANVWVYTGFHATNVYGAERLDILIVTFKDEKVDTIRLATKEQVRAAAARASATPRVAQR